MQQPSPFRLQAIRLAGPDALDFAQAQFTSDLSAPEAQRWTAAGWCDAKGRTLAILLIAVDEDGTVHLALPDALAVEIVRRLRMYQIGRKVTISDPEPVAPSTDAGWHLAFDRSRRLAVGMPGENADWTAWLAADVDAGLPWVLPATAGQFLPQMLGLEELGGLSYRKGCWPGQEVVARVRYRGRVTRKTIAFSGEGIPPEPGSRIAVKGGDGLVLYAVPTGAKDGDAAADSAMHSGLVVIPVEATNPEDSPATDSGSGEV